MEICKSKPTNNYGTIPVEEEKYLSNQNNNQLTEIRSNSSGTPNNFQNFTKSDEVSTSIVIDERTSTFDLYKGLFFMFLSCIFKSLFSVFSKIALIHNPEINSFQLLLLKSYSMVFISTFLILGFYYIDYRKIVVTDRVVIGKLFLRTICSICSTSIIIYSLKVISISDVFTVYYTYPGIVLILSVLFLKERAGKLDVVSLVACLIGVMLIIRPGFVEGMLDYILDVDHQTHSSIVEAEKSANFFTSKAFLLSLVLVAAAIKATEDLIVRNLGDSIEPVLVPIVYSFVGLILYPLPLFMFSFSVDFVTKCDLYTWCLVGSIAIFCFLMMFYMAKALQNEAACRVTMVNYLQVVFMFVTDYFLFGKEFMLYDILGTILIFGFNFGNGMHKFYKRLSIKEEKQKKFDQ